MQNAALFMLNNEKIKDLQASSKSYQISKGYLDKERQPRFKKYWANR